MIDEKEVEDIWAEWDDKAQRTMNLEPLHFDWMDALETITELRSELNATDGEKFTDRDRTISELSKENAELKTENERRLVQFEELVQKLERLQADNTILKRCPCCACPEGELHLADCKYMRLEAVAKAAKLLSSRIHSDGGSLPGEIDNLDEALAALKAAP